MALRVTITKPQVMVSGGAPWNTLIFDPINEVFFLVNPLDVGGGGTGGINPGSVETWAYRYRATTSTADVAPPVVAVTSPADAGMVSGSLTEADASDDVRVGGVQFKVDGVNLGLELVSAPWVIPWDVWLLWSGAQEIPVQPIADVGHVAVAGISSKVRRWASTAAQ